ncbi:putative transmembrane carbonic anhydrase [Mycobacterium antarcticum]|uniref:bifunctional SulP family inorganic anion transporter/carbonic anhydrase n=1 Tax=unclassified Mycolicibacterium TaxID=2636767 RepID=UPI00238BE651|nr:MULTISPECIES: bifunctional SulP family inorganic anion transporter/carbonic anhydrase [unclassified Mycolicibacterium]BDX32077.1 putative transmembrane carbonic anhydrase [Mycolicibacterium sp. TUM20985]GLP75381.1 putative transmembrane carbonic anhydrase [Mycolicibacterium sp. TUM20983]GLP84355.1 putative transmembrane carbonic anhydrase [Mycolicibacterium sp. TUM20984]
MRYDLPASLVVFLVALPLSLGIAIASGAPAMAGLIAAVVGGVVAGALGGSPLQVSGPAAGLTVIVAGLVAEFGWKVTCAITVAAGVLQVLFGVSRIARAALAISPVVVHAMLAGIGLTIVLQQVHVLLGGDSQSSAWRNVLELPNQLFGADRPGLIVGALVIVILVGWRWVPKRINKIPGPLVAIVAATAVAMVFALDVERVTLDGSLLDAIALPGLPDGNWGAFATGVLTVALIASVESLLSAVSVDRMQNGPRTNFDRELVGQGTANIASGALGGLPVTGVIVRSSANVAAGAKTRASGIMHGIWVLVFALPFAGLVEAVPMAALAGLLIVIGFQLVKRAHIETAKRTGDIAVYAVTIVGVVFLNLLEGVLIGLALSIALTVWRVVRTRIVAEPADDGTWRVVIEGSCSFLSLPRLTGVLASVPPGTKATVELSVDFIDHAAHEAIDDWRRQHCAGGGTVDIRQLGSVEMASALDGPPVRDIQAVDVRAGVMPWSSWQGEVTNGQRSEGDSSAVLNGLAIYQRRTASHMRPHLEKLAHAQEPETLFITCTDSRIVPNVITSSGPGDLFTVRNVGNLVPADHRDPSVEAAIAFAVEKLDVSSIVVCGHSSCGAMHTLLGGKAPRSPGEQHLSTWLAYGNPTLGAFDGGDHPVARAAAEAGFGPVDQLSMVNVALQVETLVRHPLVVDPHRRGTLEVFGVFYDIASAVVLRITTTGVDSFELAANPA